MEESLKKAIHQQRVLLAELISIPLEQLAQQCTESWYQREQLDVMLSNGFNNIPHCIFLYALDTNGIQISGNVSATGLMPEHFGRDRSQRPYRSGFASAPILAGRYAIQGKPLPVIRSIIIDLDRL